MSLAFAEVLAGMAQALARRGLRWYVFGAQAVLAYGTPRLTADIDAAIDARDLDRATLLGVLADAGLTPRLAGLDSPRLLPLAHEPSGIPVDVVLVSGGIDEDFLARVRSIELAGQPIPFLTPEDLLATKAVAGRRKDQEDMLGVLAQQGDAIDHARLRAVLEAFDAVLEEPRAVRTFERVLARSRRAQRSSRRGHGEQAGLGPRAQREPKASVTRSRAKRG